jgi:hypothetical protein
VGLVLARLGGVRPHEAFRADGREFALQLLMLNGWGFSHGWTWNYPSWSISTEWAGYLLFPLLALLVARCDLAQAALGAAVAAIVLLLVSGLSGSGLNLTYQGALLRFGPEFIGGILLARLLRRDETLPLGLMTAAGIMLVALGVWLRVVTTAGDAVTTIGLWLIIGRLAAGGQRVFARTPALLALGVLSYPFYMAYAPVELVFARAWAHWHLDPTRWPYLWLVPMFAGYGTAGGAPCASVSGGAETGPVGSDPAEVEECPADASIPEPDPDPQGSACRGADRLPPPHAAGGSRAADGGRHLRLAAGRAPRSEQHRQYRAGGAGRRGRAGSADAHDPAGDAVAGERALRGLREGDAAHPGPA